MIAILTPKEIERKRLLISKFKEDNIDRTEIQELIATLEKEKHIAEEEDGDGEDGMLIFAISSLVSHLREREKADKATNLNYGF